VESHCETPRGVLGEQILATVQRVDADLLVMGAYGKAPLRDFVFGSATRVVLKAIEIPVLLAH
jgi:nucleotide-binding universal stress UspA family protein